MLRQLMHVAFDILRPWLRAFAHRVPRERTCVGTLTAHYILASVTDEQASNKSDFVLARGLDRGEQRRYAAVMGINHGRGKNAASAGSDSVRISSLFLTIPQGSVPGVPKCSPRDTSTQTRLSDAKGSRQLALS
ncbi:MAG: hypothetical protein IT450_00170 [Phycisphaerales bacterium]|nr:hypothetical protein [Phycisphaerales bacterium]